jgi:hypothetical protein
VTVVVSSSVTVVVPSGSVTVDVVSGSVTVVVVSGSVTVDVVSASVTVVVESGSVTVVVVSGSVTVVVESGAVVVVVESGAVVVVVESGAVVTVVVGGPVVVVVVSGAVVVVVVGWLVVVVVSGAVVVVVVFWVTVVVPVLVTVVEVSMVTVVVEVVVDTPSMQAMTRLTVRRTPATVVNGLVMVPVETGVLVNVKVVVAALPPEPTLSAIVPVNGASALKVMTPGDVWVKVIVIPPRVMLSEPPTVAISSETVPHTTSALALSSAISSPLATPMRAAAKIPAISVRGGGIRCDRFPRALEPLALELWRHLSIALSHVLPGPSSVPLELPPNAAPLGP